MNAAADDGEHADRQSVEAVGEVDFVGGADEKDHGEHHVEPPEIRNEALEEWKDQARAVQRGLVIRQQQQRQTDGRRGDDLPAHLVAWEQAMM